MPHGTQIAQTIHAAGESFRDNRTRGSPIYAVALAARDERQLLKLEQQLLKSDIPHKAIREPDAPYYGQLMAVGIEPIDRELVRKYTKKFPLVR